VHVTILIGHFPPGSFGGAELQAEGWAKRLSDRHRVTVITRRDPADQPAREERDGFTVVRLPVPRAPLWRTLADVLAIRRAVASLEPRPDVLLCFQTFVSGLAGTLSGSALGIPVVTWIRSETEYRLDRSPVQRMLAPRVWEASRFVLVQSRQSQVEMVQALERFDRARAARIRPRVEVVENGLDLPAVASAHGTRVLGVGRLIRDKGMDVLVAAAAKVAIPLTIAGEGPERAALEAQARAAGVDCRFEGFAARERLASLYDDSACVVLAARRGEGLPNVLLEAMARGRPVIATACAGARDLVVDGVNGLVIPADDPGALADALARLARDRGLAERLGGEGRRTAGRFEWNSVRPALESVLERCAGEGR